MRKASCTLSFLILVCSTVTVKAESLSAPIAPSAAQQWMPESIDSFGESLQTMLLHLLPAFEKEFPSAIRIGIWVFACTLFISFLKNTEGYYSPAELAGTVCISSMLLRTSKIMFSLTSNTITQICEYEKLFLPIITAAAAAQGRFSAPTALYIGTSVFTTFLNNVLRSLMFPIVGLFLAISIAHCAIGETALKQLKDHIKKLAAWFLKTLLTVFFSYMSITGAISGSADRSAVKAAKAAISTIVPVIGSNLAEASEALLISAELTKNAIGLYGILVCIAIFLSPFVRIGTQYIILKVTAVLCAITDSKRLSDLVNDFCTALGLLLAVTGTMTVLSIIGAVCYLKIS